jgi:hypothetical protein
MNESVEQTWGIRFNPEPAYGRARSMNHLPGCPDWLNSYQISTWQEKGLIVWNNLDQKIEHLNGSETLRLLNQLLSDESWKTEGVSITHLVQELNMEKTHRGRNTKEEPRAKKEVSISKPVFKEMMRLPPRGWQRTYRSLTGKQRCHYQNG